MWCALKGEREALKERAAVAAEALKDTERLVERPLKRRWSARAGSGADLCVSGHIYSSARTHT